MTATSCHMMFAKHRWGIGWTIMRLLSEALHGYPPRSEYQMCWHRCSRVGSCIMYGIMPFKYQKPVGILEATIAYWCSCIQQSVSAAGTKQIEERKAALLREQEKCTSTYMFVYERRLMTASNGINNQCMSLQFNNSELRGGKVPYHYHHQQEAPTRRIQQLAIWLKWWSITIILIVESLVVGCTWDFCRWCAHLDSEA